ncbi:Fc.00g033070.m01.CDS01 [Cosmosporella sp. VM-42]
MRMISELLSLLAFVSLCSAHQNTTSSTPITSLPQCARKDLVTRTPDERLILDSKNLTQTLCKSPIRDRSGEYNAINKALGTVMGICVLARILHRLILSSHGCLNLDDWFVLATFLIGLPAVVVSVRGLTGHGLGRDVWTLDPEDIPEFMRSFYVLEALYFAQVATLRLSMLFFYLRIFPSLTVRHLLWVTIAINICYGSSFVLAAIFQCAPISYYWNRWRDAGGHGFCININAIGWRNSAISIALDLWMLGIPLSQLNRLKLHWKKKVGVAFMFIAGTIVTIISIARLQSLILFANSNNPTWDRLEITNWSAVELNAGMICTCMPSIRLMLVRLWRWIFGGNSDAALASSRNREQHARNRADFETVLSNSGRSSLQLRPLAMAVTTDGRAIAASLGCDKQKKEHDSNQHGDLAPDKNGTCSSTAVISHDHNLSAYSGSTHSADT